MHVCGLMALSAAGVQVLPLISVSHKKRSYLRKTKLVVVSFYNENNLYQMAKKFLLNTKTIVCWVKDEWKIKESKKGSSGKSWKVC